MAAVAKQVEDVVAASENWDDLSSATTLVESLSSPGSSFDIGSASICVEPSLDCASLHSAGHHSPAHSSPEASPEDMAGLPLMNFRQWMTGGAVTSQKQASVISVERLMADHPAVSTAVRPSLR